MTSIIVDNTTLILLVIILASPFVAAVRKVKFGEFEADIQSDEVNQVAKRTKEALPTDASSKVLIQEPSDTATAIIELVETDPVVALAKLRIELETRLRRLYHVAHRGPPTRQRSVSLIRMVRQLDALHVFDPAFGASLLDVIGICNRAIHGEDIRGVDARQMVRTGTDLLDAIEYMVRTYAIGHPIDRAVITATERDSFVSARYRLTTVVPLVDAPERRVYELTQEELDEFFDGYSEVAEFVVALERVA